MAMLGPRRVISELLSPAAAPASSGQIALAGLRLLTGLLWVENVVWKVPPDFGEHRRDGLYFWTHRAVEYPAFKPFSWLVEHLVLPNFTAFGWGVLVVESALAVLLLTGTAVRLAALLGIAQSIAIGLSVAEAPGEWPWAYAMMIGIHAVLLFAPSARYAAVDAVRSATTLSAARPIARRLLGGWGLALMLIGLVAVWLTVTHDWPMTVGIPRLQLSLGDYNLRGALFLVGIAAAMLATAVLSWRVLALIAAAVAAAAAIAIYIQFGRAGVWLGGTPSTAVVFVSAAVICLGTGFKIKRVKG
jgi:hypothetical protein